MDSKLTLIENTGEIAAMYEVAGLPAGHEVFIRKTDGTWKVLRMKNGVRQSWDEGYATLDDAFEIVKAEYQG